jgi:WXG100 family type VII secretion target
MSDETLVVNFAALQQASTNIQMAINTMTSQLGQLESDAAPLVSTWDGEAQAAYQQRQSIWRRAAEDLSAMLTEIKVSVDQSAADYHSTERRNTSMFR